MSVVLAGCGPTVDAGEVDASTGGSSAEASSVTAIPPASTTAPTPTSAPASTSTSTSAPDDGSTSTTTSGDEETAAGQSTAGSTGEPPPEGISDPLDLEIPEADIVWAAAFMTDETVSLRLEFAARPFFLQEPELYMRAYWWLDLDQNLGTSYGPLGAEYVIGIYGFGGPILALGNPDGIECNADVAETHIGVEILFPRSLYAIDGPFNVTAVSGVDDVETPMYDLAPDDGQFTVLEVDALPPWSGAVCQTEA